LCDTASRAEAMSHADDIHRSETAKPGRACWVQHVDGKLVLTWLDGDHIHRRPMKRHEIVRYRLTAKPPRP